MTGWTCTCGWAGETPSMTDSSSVTRGPDGEIRIDRTHLAICPRCFATVRRDTQEIRPAKEVA